MFIFNKYKIDSYQYLTLVRNDNIVSTTLNKYLLKYDNYALHSSLFIINMHYINIIFNVIFVKTFLKKFLFFNSSYTFHSDVNMNHRFYTC